MAKSYLDLMQQARTLAERDIRTVIGKLQEFSQHFPDLVDEAIASVRPTGTKIQTIARAKPLAAAAPAKSRKKRKGRKLTKVETQELRELVKASLKGKVKQVDFMEKFISDHPGYKPATVLKIVTDYRKSKVFKDEPVVKGNSKAGIYLMPGK